MVCYGHIGVNGMATILKPFAHTLSTLAWMLSLLSGFPIAVENGVTMFELSMCHRIFHTTRVA